MNVAPGLNARHASAPRTALVLLCVVLCNVPLRAQIPCASCGKPIYHGTVFSDEDKVTLKRVDVCELCEKNLTDCYICGLPASPELPGFVRMEGGRVLCARDAKTAVLTEEKAAAVFENVRDGLDRVLSRFTAFPRTNIQLLMVDQVSLKERFTLAGNDYHCPNILGFWESVTNGTTVGHRISLMSGLPASWLESVCAHEVSHAWVAEHVSGTRRKAMDRYYAEEGFCELIAFLYADAKNDEQEKARLLRNGYTQGQIDLFVAAAKTYGVNDVLDWMQYGTDEELDESDPARIHKVSIPQQRPSVAPKVAAFQMQLPPPPAFTNLMLKAIFWDEKRPLAQINDHTFGPMEEGKVRLGVTNVVVLCLAITPSSVRIRVGGSEKEEQLLLKRN